MSLRDAVMNIVEDIESDPYPTKSDPLMIAKMLRIALKSSEGEIMAPSPIILPAPQPQMPSEAHHRIMIEKAKAEFVGKRMDLEEKLSTKMVELVDGPDYDKNVPEYMDIPTDVLPGMKTVVNENIYQLHRDGKLHYLTPVVAQSLIVA